MKKLESSIIMCLISIRSVIWTLILGYSQTDRQLNCSLQTFKCSKLSNAVARGANNSSPRETTSYEILHRASVMSGHVNTVMNLRLR